MAPAFAPPLLLRAPRPQPPAPRTPRRARVVCRADRLERRHVALPGRAYALELVSAPCDAPRAGAAPVVFVHGSFHAAWCWERYLQRVAAHAPAHAVSLRGYTSRPPLLEGVVDPGDHIADIAALLDVMDIPPPVLVGHSIGGYFAQRVAQQLAPGRIAGLVLMSSVPPGGNGKLVRRITMKAGLGRFWRMTAGFVFRKIATDPDICREMFFTLPDSGVAVDDELEGPDAVNAYMQRFAQACGSRTDTKLVVPLVPGPHDAAMKGRVLVIGGADDAIVDVQAMEETAAFWGAEDNLVVLPHRPHDLMLATGWQEGADAILEWMKVSMDRSPTAVPR